MPCDKLHSFGKCNKNILTIILIYYYMKAQEHHIWPIPINSYEEATAAYPW